MQRTVNMVELIEKQFSILKPNRRKRPLNTCLSIFVITMTGFAISIGAFSAMPSFAFLVPLIGASLWLMYELIKINDAQDDIWYVLTSAIGGLRVQFIEKGADEEDVRALEVMVEGGNIVGASSCLVHIYNKLDIKFSNASSEVQEEII